MENSDCDFNYQMACFQNSFGLNSGVDFVHVNKSEIECGFGMNPIECEHCHTIENKINQSALMIRLIHVELVNL